MTTPEDKSNTADQRSMLQRGVAFFRESVRDSDTDYTRGPIGRALGLLAIPMMLEMSMESIFAVVDIAFAELWQISVLSSRMGLMMLAEEALENRQGLLDDVVEDLLAVGVAIQFDQDHAHAL